jgi:hypothetical protein
MFNGLIWEDRVALWVEIGIRNQLDHSEKFVLRNELNEQSRVMNMGILFPLYTMQYLADA